MVGTRGAALRYRPWQALGLLSLATLITAAIGFAPLHTRAMEESLVRQDLAHSEFATTALDVTSHRITVQRGARMRSVGLDPLDPRKLVTAVPHAVRRDYLAPQLGRTADAGTPVGPLAGQIRWREGQCAHITLLSGRCPTGPGEIAVSRADLLLPGIRLGATVGVFGVTLENGPPPIIDMHVVGVYRPIDSAFWQGRTPTGSSGSSSAYGVGHDDWLTSEQTFTQHGRPPLPELISSATFPIAEARIGVAALNALGPALTRFTAAPVTGADADRIEASTGLGELAHDLRTQSRQARTTVPLLTLQIVLLALVVLWQLLAAATEQRRPEVALALLRGRGRTGARRQVAGELLPVVLTGVPLGAALAVGLNWFARHLYLPMSPPFALTQSFGLALVAAVVTLTAITALAAHLTARESVQSLLRTVRPRHRTGLADVVLIAVVATGAVVFLAGGLRGSTALAGPALIAVLVGLLLAHATAPVAARSGRRALRHGHLRTGLALLDAARNPAARRTIAMLTVAVALLVFSADAVSVAARNRQLAAEQDVGADRVLTVAGADLAAVRAAVGAVDPRGERLTPVVTISQSAGIGAAPTTLAVVPDQFARIALLDGDSLPWGRLLPPPARPLRITATTLRMALTGSIRAASTTVGVGLTLVESNGTVTTVPLGSFPVRRATTVRRTLSGSVPCASGCVVSSLVVTGQVGNEVRGRLHLGPLQTGAGRVTALGTVADWSRVASPSGVIVPTGASAGGLSLRFDTISSQSLTLPQAWLPLSFPAIVAGALPPTSKGNEFTMAGLDGANRAARRIASATRVPGAPARAVVADLDALSRGAVLADGAQIQVWLASAAPALARQTIAALASRGVTITDNRSVSDQRHQYDASVAAWSIGLGVVVGIVALLMGLLALLLVALTSWRARSQEFAALRMAGVPMPRIRTAAVAGQLVTLAVAVAAGVAAGVLGASVALDQVPLFARRPAISTLDLSTSWGSVLGVAVAAVVVLGAGGWWSVRFIAGRARLSRIRETT